MSRDVRQSDGLSGYRSFDPPPAGFDPLTAPNEVLLRYGLPRRPDQEREPELARIWERAFARPLRYSRAELAIDDVMSARDPLRTTKAEFGSNNWAGAIVRHGEPFSWVFSEWVIPNVPAKSFFADDVTIGFWVGIDGVTIGNDQVLQAGVAVTMTSEWFMWGFVPYPRVVVHWRVFTEWWVKGVPGTHAVWVTNFPVKPGDTVSFVVCAPQPDSPAWVNMLNVSTGQHRSVEVPTPKYTTGEPVMLQGDAVEWILEVVEPAAPNLPKFDPITFTECLAGKPNTVVDLLNAFEVNIIGPNGDLTEVQLVQPRTATVRRKDAA